MFLVAVNNSLNSSLISQVMSPLIKVCELLQINFKYVWQSWRQLVQGISIFFSTMADLIATAALCWKVSNATTGAQRSYFILLWLRLQIQHDDRTQTVLHRLLLYFFTRAVLVTLNGVLHLILFAIRPMTLYWSVSYRSCIGRMFTCRFLSRMPFQLLACKLYVNTTCKYKYDSCGIRLSNQEISVSGHVRNFDHWNGIWYLSDDIAGSTHEHPCVCKWMLMRWIRQNACPRCTSKIFKHWVNSRIYYRYHVILSSPDEVSNLLIVIRYEALARGQAQNS
jgi:hypothetical protein